MGDKLQEKVSGDSEQLRKSYLDEEVNQLYELARLWLENGDIKGAELIVNGLVEVAPSFAPAWLALCILQTQANDMDGATKSATQAYRCDPNCVEAILFLTACLITNGDLSRAGTFLGEVAEKVDAGEITNQSVVRFYRAQLARYQNR